MKEILNKLNKLENLAVEVQMLAYFAAPSEKGCPKGHMGHRGCSSADKLNEDEEINLCLDSLNKLLEETHKDLAKITKGQILELNKKIDSILDAKEEFKEDFTEDSCNQYCSDCPHYHKECESICNQCEFKNTPKCTKERLK